MSSHSMNSQPPTGGHLAIPQNDIYTNDIYTNEPPTLKGHFPRVTRVAAHNKFYCMSLYNVIIINVFCGALF